MISRNKSLISRNILIFIFLSILPFFVFASNIQLHSEITTDSGYYKDNYYLVIKLKIDNGWKVYASDQGDVGTTPQVAMTGNDGIKIIDINWPSQVLIEEYGLKSYIYRNYIEIPLTLELPYLPITTNLNVNYVICNDVCIPVTKNIELILKDQQIDAKYHRLFKSNDNNLIYIICIALLGGLILNLMPCILPVLSIKIFSIIKSTNLPVAKLRKSMLLTSFGIVFSFFIIAVTAIIFKQTGKYFGLGINFQQPGFLIFLIITLFIFALNLCNRFEFRFAMNNKYLGDFLTGAFATILATPCSAPFVGTAVSFAITHNAFEIIIIFIAMGVGMSIPYLLIAAFPVTHRFLPKPGNWMIKLRFILGVGVFLTVVWLLSVLISQLGFMPVIILIMLLLLLKFSIETLQGTFQKISIISIVALSFVLPFTLQQQEEIESRIANKVWLNFEQDKIAAYIKEGKIVIVDVTADWCMTCKINKFTTLESMHVLNYIISENIIAMRADITKHDAKVMSYLNSFKRYAIPFNVIYTPKNPNGVVLQEILTPTKFVKAIKDARQ